MDFLFVLFFILIFAGLKIGRLLAKSLFGNKPTSTYTYIDKTVHNHYHEHKHINVFDGDTKEKIIKIKKNTD